MIWSCTANSELVPRPGSQSTYTKCLVTKTTSFLQQVTISYFSQSRQIFERNLFRSKRDIGVDKLGSGRKNAPSAITPTAKSNFYKSIFVVSKHSNFYKRNFGAELVVIHLIGYCTTSGYQVSCLLVYSVYDAILHTLMLHAVLKSRKSTKISCRLHNLTTMSIHAQTAQTHAQDSAGPKSADT